ncbi:MAG: DNA recombination protein RmuC [Deltaproteobacteria bacterium]|nr:DNA recombination protein RmuC [Deltaproteobacteria bacterium]
MPDSIHFLTALLMLATVILLIIEIWTSGIAARNAEKAVREEIRMARGESTRSDKELREEVSNGLKNVADSMVNTMGEMADQQANQLDSVSSLLREITETHEAHIEKIRDTVDAQLRDLHEGNERKLEEMRQTVDEKLHGTIEKRLGESFTLLSERLEAVQHGLGEMKNLATGVGDLKKVLSSVQARGAWGEIQLGSLLEQILTPDQYEKNVHTRDRARTTAEFAIKLPGPDHRRDTCVWLPIDSKFPHDEYSKLLQAAESGDGDEVHNATSHLVKAIKHAAKELRDHHLNPPKTTDFAIMFLPIEGLYAEVLRQPGLVEDLQQNYRVVAAGPTTLAAILNSLRMGFRTFVIEQRASEVWKVLAAVKTEFHQFGEVLDKIKSQLNTARSTIEETGARTRAMERKLEDVEQLPPDAADEILKLRDLGNGNGVEMEDTVAHGNGVHEGDEPNKA